MNSAIIQVMIGVLFVYILLSLLVSQINQVIAYVLNIRAEQLRKRIGEIVVDPSVQKQILSHPLVGLVSDSTKGGNRRTFISNRTAQISQVASSSFAKAMVNIFTDPYLELYSAIALVRNEEERDTLEEIVTQLRANANDPTRSVAVLNHLHEKINQLTPADRKDRKALLRSLGSVSASLRSLQSGNSRLYLLLEGVNRVENRAFQQAMDSILTRVQDVHEAEAAIEEWFTNKMDQTKSVYAMTMQALSLGVGIFLAIALNVDSLQLAKSLWTDPILRNSLSTLAQTTDLASAIESSSTLDIPLDGSTTDQIVQSYATAQGTVDQLLALNLPIGWTFRIPTEADATTGYQAVNDPRNLYALVNPFSGGNWLFRMVSKIFGLLLTAFAVAQGAPFWFDILRRLTNPQGSGSSSPNVVIHTTNGQSA
ncbi:MAG: hypothetical protein ACOYLB_04575 [Phototrophicaceae bacterium]